MANTALDLKAIEARCEAATRGPWYASKDQRGYEIVSRPTNKFYAGFDCEFIAHARADVPALVAEARRLRHDLHDEQVRCDEWKRMYYQAIADIGVERLQGRLGQVKAALDNEVDSRVRAELEVERLQAELTRVRTDMNEVWAENTRLAASYQDDADAMCEALGIEWTDDNEYPTVALSAIAQVEALAALVTPELAELLARLAYDASKRANLDDSIAARKLAICIREALEETE